MSVCALRRARRCATTWYGDFNGRAHPRVDAALELADADWKIRTSCRRAVFSCARGNENHRPEVQAFGRGYRVAGNAVQIGNESSTKLSHLRKRVDFTAAILDLGRTANVQLCLARLITPFMRVLSCCEFRDECIKSRVSVADARAVAQHSIKTGGFTIVVHAEFLVA